MELHEKKGKRESVTEEKEVGSKAGWQSITSGLPIGMEGLGGVYRSGQNPGRIV